MQYLRGSRTPPFRFQQGLLLRCLPRAWIAYRATDRFLLGCGSCPTSSLATRRTVERSHAVRFRPGCPRCPVYQFQLLCLESENHCVCGAPGWLTTGTEDVMRLPASCGVSGRHQRESGA